MQADSAHAPSSPLRVIGAGLPRTGTTSLKNGLELLLGERCYHMFELFDDFDAGIKWWQALEGDIAKIDKVLDDYGAAVDWPASLFWRELMAKHPDAVVVLSHRGDAETWWRSVDRTVWAMLRRRDTEPTLAAFNEKMRAKGGFGDDWDDPTAAMAVYDRLFAEVTSTVPADRLVVWQASDGWEPLCTALGIDVPDEPFPHLNSTGEFRDRAGLE